MKNPANNGKVRRLLSLLLCLAMVFALASVSLQRAEAAGDKVKVVPLSYGKHVKGDSYTYRDDSYTSKTYKLFKVNVPKPGYLTFRVYPNNGYLCKVYKSTKSFLREDYPNDDAGYCYDYWMIKNQQSQYLMPIGKGTYYIYMADHYDFSVKFTAKSPVNNNYCMRKAQSAKAGVKYILNVMPGYTNDRWYKLTLSKPRDIQITFRNLLTGRIDSDQLRLYNAKGEVLSLDEYSDGVYSSTRLDKGTYYIRLRFSYFYSDEYARYRGVYQFSWK